jgi:putative ABC transport system permease protein
MPETDSQFRKKHGSISFMMFWSRFTFRHVRDDWFQTLLLLLILGLGVGTFLSIRMANRAAVEGFRLFTDSLKGASDFIVESKGGGIPVSELRSIRDALNGVPAELYPVVEVPLYPLREGMAGRLGNLSTIRLLGLDLVQLQGLVSSFEEDDMTAFWEMLDKPRQLLISETLSQDLELSVGSKLEVSVVGKREVFEISGILPAFQGTAPLPGNLAVMDLPILLDCVGRAYVDRVEIRVPEGSRRLQNLNEVAHGLRETFGSTLAISSPEDKSFEGATMTTAFRLNLSVLSLVALLVGLFLIAQTLDATVSKRRKEIATLRSLGISPQEIYRLWLSEAILYGLAAGALGILVGYALSAFTVEAVTTTVSSLYKETSQAAASINTTDVLLSFTIGVVGSLVAAYLPARDAASTPPAQCLRLGKRIPPFPIFERTGIALVMLVTGFLLAFAPPWSPQPGLNIPAAGYTTALLWLSGGTLTAASGLKFAGWLIRRSGGNSAPILLAGSRLAQPTSRHQLALAGFFVAIGMASAMTFLINSFEQTVTHWLQQRLKADLFISSAGFQGGESGPRIAGGLLDEIEQLEGIRAVDRFRSQETSVSGVRFSIAGVRFDLLGTDQDLLWLNGPTNPSSAYATYDAIGYANENFTRRTGLGMGEYVQVSTPGGEKTILIAGIHADYARDNGLLLVDLPLLESWFSFNEYETASVFLGDVSEVDAVQMGLRQAYPGLNVRNNSELMETALFIFHQTFSVTRALQMIGLTVALAGLVLSLLSLLRESGKELSLQRTLGMSRHEISITTAVEGFGVAFVGMISGLLLGAMLGIVLIYVINRQSFGWTLQATYPWKDCLILGLGVMFLGLGISYATGRIYIRKWRKEPL